LRGEAGALAAARITRPGGTTTVADQTAPLIEDPAEELIAAPVPVPDGGSERRSGV
jgi:hypothetical protein